MSSIGPAVFVLFRIEGAMNSTLEALRIYVKDAAARRGFEIKFDTRISLSG